MGFWTKLFGSANYIDVKNEYTSLLDSIQVLAKAGAAYGQHHGFFMHIQCLDATVYISIKVEFGDHLKFLRDKPACLVHDLEMRGVNEDEFNFLLKTLRITHEDERHDVGSAEFAEQLKRRSHAQSVFEAIKERLIETPHTTHSIDNNQLRICLFDE